MLLLQVGDVFDKTRGFFRVPLGGSGEYTISVGMVQRVFDWQFTFGEPQNVLSQYVIYVGDNPLNEALLASDNGANSNADLVQASRSIVLHLKEGDTVKLVKEDTRDQHAPHASSDLFLTFCVSMKHLDAALNLGRGQLISHDIYNISFSNRFSACCSSNRPFHRLGVLVVQGANTQYDRSPRRDRDYQPPEPVTNDQR